MSRSQRQYLLDILDAMDAAEAFVKDMTFEDLESDLRTQDGYFAVELEIVWDTVHERFPKEKPRLRKVLRELPSESE